MMDAGGGDLPSVGGGKVMEEAGSGERAWMGLPKAMMEGGRWERVQKQLLLRKKVTRESGGSDRASAGLGNAMADVVGIPEAIMEACDWLDWGEVKKQLLRVKVIKESGGGDQASADLENVMAEVAGIPKAIMERGDWLGVLRKRLRAKVIREIKEKEGGALASAGGGEVMAEAGGVKVTAAAGGGDLASAGGGKMLAVAGCGDMAEAGGGEVIMEAEVEGGNWAERRRVPKKYLKAKTCVIWDMEKRPFPDFCKPAEIARFIRSIVSSMGFGGEVDIIAVGDTRFIENQIDLLRSGIVVKFSDSLSYPRQSDDVLEEILSWERYNSTPGNILLISRDRSLSAVLRSISDDGYYIIRVRESKSTGYQAVGGAPDYWDWSDLQEAAGPQQKEVSLGVAKATWVGGNWASRNRVDEKFLRAKTCVIWDIERRLFPVFCKPCEIDRFIKSVVSHMGFVGKVDIIAVGNTRKIERDVAMALYRSGIVLKHSDGGSTYPPGVFAETSLWTEHNLPPAIWAP